jgi:hypothetical protein
MTISHAQPERYAVKTIKLMLIVIFVLCVGSVLGYNQMIEARAAKTQVTKRIEALTSENATLKNDLYTVIDSRSLTMQAERLGYIKDSNPTYLQFLADGSVREGSKVSLLDR